jgi:hypothetical protein
MSYVTLTLMTSGNKHLLLIGSLSRSALLLLHHHELSWPADMGDALHQLSFRRPLGTLAQLLSVLTKVNVPVNPQRTMLMFVNIFE